MARGFIIPSIHFIILIKIFNQNIHNLFASVQTTFTIFRCTDKVQNPYILKLIFLLQKKQIAVAGLSQHCSSFFLNHVKID